MSPTKTSEQLLSKAETLVRWTKASLDEMREHGRQERFDDIERMFFSILALIASTHDALHDCADEIGRSDWWAELDGDRTNDPLLLYMYKARDLHIHTKLLEWKPNFTHIQFRIVNEEKARLVMRGFFVNIFPEQMGYRMMQFIYGVGNPDQLSDAIKSGRKPHPDLVDRAGIEFIDAPLRALSLVPIEARVKKGRLIKIDPPTIHFGKHLPPSADQATQFAIDYYEGKTRELRKIHDEGQQAELLSESE